MILVTGVGRSGTTFTARVLQGLGVDMGAGDDPSLEDAELRTALCRFGYGRTPTRRDQAALAVALRAHMERAEGRSWGVKDPRILDAGADFWLALADAGIPEPWEIVFCERAVIDVLRSWVRVTTSSESEAMRHIRWRLDRQAVLRDVCGRRDTVVTLDFTRRRSEADIGRALSGLVTVREAEAREATLR